MLLPVLVMAPSTTLPGQNLNSKVYLVHSKLDNEILIHFSDPLSPSYPRSRESIDEGRSRSYSVINPISPSADGRGGVLDPADCSVAPSPPFPLIGTTGASTSPDIELPTTAGVSLPSPAPSSLTLSSDFCAVGAFG